MTPKKGDGFHELYGIPPVSGAKYFKDGHLYNAKLQRINEDGTVDLPPEAEVDEFTGMDPPGPPAEQVVDPEVEEATEYIEGLELVDRIKIKRSSDPNFLKKKDIHKELAALGFVCDKKELRDDLLCRLKEAMGLTKPADLEPDLEPVEDRPAPPDPDSINIDPEDPAVNRFPRFEDI